MTHDVSVPDRPNFDLIALLTTRGFCSLGRMRVRSASEISGSPWTVGAETLDRGFSDFEESAPYLGALGAKRVRLQAGWATCEPRPGEYEWAWLDRIVELCAEQGVDPWLQTSYGNPAYPDGGGEGLGGDLPSGKEALAAWDRWVTALVERYGDRCSVWEIWNEPELLGQASVKAYTELFVRTARIVRERQPAAKIIGLGLAGHALGGDSFAEGFLRELHGREETALLDEIAFHFYRAEPEKGLDDHAADLERLCRLYAPHVRLVQGENGAPSKSSGFGALKEQEWSERKQAVWDLRRMLSHHARGYAMSLFTLADMHYTVRLGDWSGHNSKGLLASEPDKKITHRKHSYFAAQHVFSLLDDRFPLERTPVANSHMETPHVSRVWHVRGRSAPAMIAWWSCAGEVCLETAEPGRIRIEEAEFEDPVLLDFLSGTVFDPPKDFTPHELPCSDSPLALVERSLVEIER